MKKESIDSLVKLGVLRPKQLDFEKIKSALKFAEINVNVAKAVPLNENSATLIFREIYESVKQLGDISWWLLGYEPSNHEISMDILKETEIKDKVKLNFLDRFKKIRHDANYRGFMVLESQAKEMLEFWDTCGKEILKLLKAKAGI